MRLLKTEIIRPLPFSSVLSLSCVPCIPTPRTPARHASLSTNNSRGSLKLMSIESEMPSKDLILYRSLFFLPSIFPSIRVFSNESVLHIRWPKYWNFSFSISSVQSLSHVHSLGAHGLQYATFPGPTPTPGPHSDSCQLSR